MNPINDLNTLHPELKKLILQLLELCKQNNLNVDVFETFRTAERSNLLYKKGTGTKAGYSYHNYGLACDIVFKNAKGWTWDSKMNWKKLGELGKSIGLEWGGDWTMRDYPHFQLTFGLSINDLLIGKRPPQQDLNKKWALDNELCNDQNWDKSFTKLETIIVLKRFSDNLKKGI